MYKLLALGVTIIALSSCSDSDDAAKDAVDNALNKDVASVALSNLSGHVITYEEVGGMLTKHTEGYCGPAILTTNGEDTIGIWSLASANELNALTTAGTINHAYTTTDGKLVKNVTYATTTTTPGSTTTDQFKITNISEIICVVSL